MSLSHLCMENVRFVTFLGTARWNDLPAHVTAAPSLAVFRQRLKTFLFCAHILTLSVNLTNYVFFSTPAWTYQ